MDFIDGLIRELAWELASVIDWAMRNWAITAVILVLLIFTAGKQKRSHRHSH
jgi:hypothetical protein